MDSSFSKTLVICGTVLIVSPWAGIVAETMAVGNMMAARSDLNSGSVGSSEPFGIACGIIGLVMIVFACWKSGRATSADG